MDFSSSVFSFLLSLMQLELVCLTDLCNMCCIIVNNAVALQREQFFLCCSFVNTLAVSMYVFFMTYFAVVNLSTNYPNYLEENLICDYNIRVCY